MAALLSDPSSIRIALCVVFVPVLLLAVRSLRLSVEGDGKRREADTKDEKRRAHRESSDAVFDLDDGKGNFKPGNAHLVDMSVWGARISSEVPLSQGQQIRGRIRSSAEGRLEISGHVVWVKPNGNLTLYGIEFDKVTRSPA